MIKKTEIDALIKLLDDQDSEVFEHVHDRLVSMGEDAIPKLEDAWAKSFDGLLQKRIEDLIHHIQLTEATNSLRLWNESGAKDLLDGAIAVARYQFPDVDTDKIIGQLEAIKQNAWLEIHQQQTPMEKIKVLNEVIYDRNGFKGNTKNYHDPHNSYINAVLESKKGNQISLAIVYMLIAQSLDVPVYGVNLPQHFVLAYKEENRVGQEDIPSRNPSTILPKEESPHGILFYINPFNRGFVFTRRDIDYFLKQLKIDPIDAYYDTCSNLDIVKRVLRNLVNSYRKMGSAEKAEELTEIFRIFESD